MATLTPFHQSDVTASSKASLHSPSHSPTGGPARLRAPLSRSLILTALGQVSAGRITLADDWGINQFGADESLTATVTVTQPRAYRRILTGGDVAAGEAYLDGDWDCDNLTALLRILLRNRAALDNLNSWTSWLAQGWNTLQHRLRSNTRRRAKSNIQAHYDLSNEFYSLWLDDTWAYSAAIFPTPDTPLALASQEKFDRICQRLQLQPGDSLLEIGCGWGGFALHAAQEYGCHVTATTISSAQFAIATERIQAAGLQSRVQLLQQDYRDLAGKFDKIASIEMIEAVGHEHLDAYFRSCAELLRPGGRLAIQAITMPEARYDAYLKGADFIQKYIFPGGCLPSIGGMLDAVGRTGSLHLVRVDDYGLHYAETLRRWRDRFEGQLASVRQLGFDERFIRLWRYYLCYCEAAFEERAVGLAQLLWEFPQPDGGPGLREEPPLR